MNLSIRPATLADAEVISDILAEASRWLEQAGRRLWEKEHFSVETVTREIGVYFLAEVDQTAAGTLRFETEDKMFWPDQPEGDSAYLHRLAIRRSFAGGKLSHAILAWAVERARSLGKKQLRLDCLASRPTLRRIYENFGFIHHSDRQVGPYFVARYEYKL